jgi:hypothetical protein
MRKGWREGEVYPNSPHQGDGWWRFPVRTENEPPALTVGVWGNSTRELQLVYAAASVLSAERYLDRCIAYEAWLSNLETTEGMQILRAEELKQRPDWARRNQALADPFVARVDLAIQRGATTLVAINEQLPTASYGQIHDALSTLEMPRSRLRSTILNELLSHGERSIELMCEKLSVTPLALWGLFHQEPRFEEHHPDRAPILYTSLTPWYDSERLMLHVERGESLESIARGVFEGGTREFARQQIAARNLTERLKVRRAARREAVLGSALDDFSRARRDLLTVFTKRAMSLAPPAQQQAIAHFLHGATRTPLARLIEVYKGMELGRAQGLSPTQVAQSLDMSYSQLYELMQRSPFPDLLEFRRSAPRVNYQNFAPKFDACVGLGFSVRSIESFIGRRIPCYKPTKPSTRHTDYYRLSQIYEAADSGFTAEDTATLLGAQLGRVKEGLVRRVQYEPVIVQGLQVLFEDQTITKPYLLNQTPRR